MSTPEQQPGPRSADGPPVAETFPVYGATDAPHLESLPADPAAGVRPHATYGVRSTQRSRGAAVAFVVVALLMMIVFFGIFAVMAGQTRSSTFDPEFPTDRDIPGGPVLPGDMMTE